MKTQISIFDRPKNVNLHQFILEINGSIDYIKNKYSIYFEADEDDISPVQLALLTDGCENYFLIVARPDIEDCGVSVFTQNQDDLTSAIESFVSMLNMDSCDISSRVDQDL